MKKLMYGVVLLSGVAMLSGCNILAAGSDAHEKEFLVEKDSADRLEVQINMGAGELSIEGGSKEWVTGDARYNNKDLEPEISYKLKGETGKLSIDQSKHNDIDVNKGGLKNEWDVQLSNTVPMELVVSSGVADSSLHFGGIQLEDLQINAGVGDLEVDLTGEWNQGFDVHIDMGVGETSLIVPKDVGVKVISEKGLGSRKVEGLSSEGDGVYVNDKYGNSDILITVYADLGVGEFEVREE